MNRLSLSSLVLLVSCGDDAKPGVNPDAPGKNPDAAVDGPATDAPISELGLVLHYEFEDASTVVTDGSPNAKHGTLSNASGWTADGRIGRALAMTGANPADIFVSVPSGVLTGVDDFTISFWLKMKSIAPWARVYDFGNGLADPANRFMFFTPNGFLPQANGVMATSYGGSGANEIALTSGTQLPTNVWKHVAIVGTAGARTVFIDGFPASQVTNGPLVPPREMEPLVDQSWLGRSRFPDPGLDGTLDDFKIYSRALTATEVADQAQPKRDYAHWRFDENTGMTTRDFSELAIPTTLGTGVTWTAGRLGSAVDFAGGAAGPDGPTVTLASNPLAACTTELTVAAWVKLDTVQAWSRVFDFGTATTRFIYLAPSDGAGMHFAMVAPTGVFDLVSPTVPVAADGNFHHLAVTVAADHTVRLFADGQVVASGTSPVAVTPADFASMTDLWLGKSRFPDPYLDGAIDELRIGCRALTNDEIVNLAHR
jgi:hypothetical protein